MLRKIRITAAAVCCYVDHAAVPRLHGNAPRMVRIPGKNTVPARTACPELSAWLQHSYRTHVAVRDASTVRSICPLGVMQDAVFVDRGKTTRKNRCSATHRPSRGCAVRCARAFHRSCSWPESALSSHCWHPYSAYGRIASNLIAPLYLWGNNLLAYLAERAGSYAFLQGRRMDEGNRHAGR